MTRLVLGAAALDSGSRRPATGGGPCQPTGRADLGWRLIHRVDDWVSRTTRIPDSASSRFSRVFSSFPLRGICLLEGPS